MHSLIVITILAGACVAHYRGGYENRNLIEREEPGVAGVLVECPVCENIDSILPNHEECNIIKGGKRYKKCERGTYVNEVCGNRVDCYRGPGEKCTEKMAFDNYGVKCARGFYCNEVFHECTGLGYNIDSNTLWILNGVYRFPLPFSQERDRASTKSEPAVILA